MGCSGDPRKALGELFSIGLFAIAVFIIIVGAMIYGAFHPAPDCPRGSVTQAGIARCL